MKNINLPPFICPIRIPENIELMRTEPAIAHAGENGTWKLCFKLAQSIANQDIVRLQIYGGRNNRGVFKPLQSDNPKGNGYISVQTQDRKKLEIISDIAAGQAAKKNGQVLTGVCSNPGLFIIRIPENGLCTGRIIEVFIGDTSHANKGVDASESSLYNKFFVIYKAQDANDRPGFWGAENWHQIIGACSMHIIGGATQRIRAYAPAQCKTGDKITLLLRPEDSYGNMSSERPEGLNIFLNGKAVDAEIKHIPQSACVNMICEFNEPGVLRPVIRDASGHEAVCTPIITHTKNIKEKAYWGMIHGHTEISDGAGTLDYYFKQMRDESRLDFAATGDHDHLWETPDSMWRTVCETVERYNDPGRFVTFLGYEWAKWRQNGDGDRNVYYADDNKPIYRSDEGHCPTPPDLFKALKDEKAIIIPHHTANKGNWCDWKDHDKEHERLVEIFQIRGSYECKNNNPCFPEEAEFKQIGFVEQALKMGWRVGFTAGGDDHSGHAGTDTPKAGLMCVWADKLDRASLWQALWQRRVTATSGSRILLSFKLNGHPMGEEISAAQNHQVREKRVIEIEYHGTAALQRIDIMRNSDPVHSFALADLDKKLTWTDAEPLEKVLLEPAIFCANRFCYYYVRVIQQDGHMAWASPVWIDV